MSSNLVRSEGEHASPYSLAIIGVKSNIITFSYICRLIVTMSYCGRMLIMVLNTPISKVWGRASRAQRPLPTGIVKRQFPSLRDTTWRNNRSSTRNGLVRTVRRMSRPIGLGISRPVSHAPSFIVTTNHSITLRWNMMTSSNGNIFHVTRSFGVFFDMCLKKRLSTQSRRWRF